MKKIPLPHGSPTRREFILAGVSRALGRANPNALAYAMEPAEAAILLGEAPCCHFIEGVADGFVPPLMKNGRVDGSVPVNSGDARHDRFTAASS